MFYYKLFPNCLVVKGIRRSSIYDLVRNDLYLIPNGLIKIINKRIFTESEIKTNYRNIFHALLKNEVFITLKNKVDGNLFPKLNLKWNYPAVITNTLIMHSGKLNYKQISMELEKVGCKNVQIVFNTKINENELDKVLNNFESSIVSSIELILSTPFISNKYLNVLCRKHQRISYIKVFNSMRKSNYLNRIFHSTIPFKVNNTYLSDINSINININLFTESLSFNNYYNRKLIIDENGKIKRSLLDSVDFGNINIGSMYNCLKNSNFKKYWRLNKDKIQYCKDCELRYCCIDSRLPYLKKGKWQFDTKCNYNPYKLEWRS